MPGLFAEERSPFLLLEGEGSGEARGEALGDDLGDLFLFFDFWWS